MFSCPEVFCDIPEKHPRVVQEERWPGWGETRYFDSLDDCYHFGVFLSYSADGILCLHLLQLHPSTGVAASPLTTVESSNRPDLLRSTVSSDLWRGCRLSNTNRKPPTLSLKGSFRTRGRGSQGRAVKMTPALTNRQQPPPLPMGLKGKQRASAAVASWERTAHRLCSGSWSTTIWTWMRSWMCLILNPVSRCLLFLVFPTTNVL